MSDEDLDRVIDDAAVALRAETSGPASSAGATRARILASHRAARERSARAWTWLAAAAVVMVVLGGSTAWAYWTGRLDALFAPSAPEAPSEVPSTATPPTPHTGHPVATPATEPAPTEPAPVEPAPVVALPEPVTPALDPTPTSAPSAETDAPDESASIVDPRERRAYREAHALHFVDHDPAGALGAWDAYLAAYPRGRFALEARYNRALCLVRLGRSADAEEALAPFASGTHGGYRQHEAAALLEALEQE